jgi:hypothetical protein
MLDIYVINLLEQVDRFERIKNDFKDFNIIRVNAIKHENGAIGCMASHKKCISIAKENGLKNIIVLEDDCKPINNMTERLLKIKEYLDNNDNWHLFIGGVNYTRSENIINKIDTDIDFLVNINMGCMTHFMIYNEKIYDFILNLDENVEIADRAWHYKYNAIIPLPFIAYQYGGYSNISKNDVTRKFNNYFKNTQSALLKYYNLPL